MGELAEFAVEYGIAALQNPGSFFFRSTAGISPPFAASLGNRQPYEGKWKFVRESGGKSRAGRGESNSFPDRYTLTIRTRDFENGISQEALTRLFAEQVYFPQRATKGAQYSDDEKKSNFDSLNTSKAELLSEYVKRKCNITAETKQHLKANCKTIGELVTDFYFLNGDDLQSDPHYSRNRNSEMKIFGDCGELTKAQYDQERAKKASLTWASTSRKRVSSTKIEEDFNGWMFPDASQEVGAPKDKYHSETAICISKTDNRTNDGNNKPKKYFRSTKWIIFGGSGFNFPNLKVLKINFIHIKKLVLSASNAPKLELLWVEQVNYLEYFRFSLPSLKVLQLDHAYSLNARDLANSISASPNLKKLVFVKNYGMAHMPPIHLPCLKEVDCWRGDDLNRFVFHGPKLQDTNIKLDRLSVDEFKVRGEFKRFEKLENFVQSFFLENRDLAEKCTYFQEQHEKYWSVYTTSENRFRMILNDISNPDLAMQIFEQGMKVWSSEYVDAFAATGNEAFYSYYTTDVKSEFNNETFNDVDVVKQLPDELSPKRQKTEP